MVGLKTNKNRLFDVQLINTFADFTGCAIQHNGCPCNSCVHVIDDKTDFKHIVWLILLGLRGDYDEDVLIKDIKKELKDGAK